MAAKRCAVCSAAATASALPFDFSLGWRERGGRGEERDGGDGSGSGAARIRGVSMCGAPWRVELKRFARVSNLMAW